MRRSALVIRRAKIFDLNALVDLLKDLFAIEKDFAFNRSRQMAGLRDLLQNKKRACVLVAEMDGTVVGMCTLQVLMSTAEGGRVGLIEDMVVAKTFRHQGIGRKLLASMEKFSYGLGLTRLQLLADRENQPALNFYLKHGWQNTQLICLRKK